MGYAQVKVITDLMGGSGVLGQDVRTQSDLLQIIAQGFPFVVLEHVAQTLGLSREEVAAVLVMPTRTLSRRKQAKHLHAQESDRLFRFVRVAAHAGVALGSLEKAAQWLHRSNRALGGEIPLNLLNNDIGAVQVDDLLTRIEQGIMS